MTKLVKLSLVAAVAVAGLNAASLEEAIKGVDISGKLEVEYDYSKTDTTGVDTATSNAWDYDWDITAKVPLSDQWTAIAGFQADDGENVRAAGNADAAVTQTKYYFQYANGPVTAMAGKMGMAGAPWFDDERGSGVVAMYNAGAVVAAAAHYTNVNGHALAAVEDVRAAALIAPNIADSGISASLWYADVSNVGNSYSLNINGKIMDLVSVDFRHTDVDFGDIDGGDARLTKVVASADLAMINARIGYGTTNDNDDAIYLGLGGDLATTVNFEGIGGDNDSAVTFGLEQLNIADLNDSHVWYFGLGTTVANVSLNADYINGDAADKDIDFNELKLSAKYPLADNLKLTGFYSMAEFDIDNVSDTDMDAASIALEYKF